MTALLTWIWPDTPLVLLLIVVIALVARIALVHAIKAGVDASLAHARERQARQGSRAERILAAATGVSSARHEARARTIGAILRSTVTVVIAVLAVLMMLETVGAPLGALVASAGLLGVALGVGAQSLVKDVLAGIFIILEDQFGVGDLIDTPDVKGTVEDIGLRVTRLRDPDGEVWYVRNGELNRVGNQSQGWSTAAVEVPVAPDEDATRVIDLLKEAAAEVYADPKWESVMLDKPDVAGVERVTSGEMVIKIFAKCAPNQQWGVQRDILERAQRALRAAGIRGAVALPGTPSGKPGTAS